MGLNFNLPCAPEAEFKPKLHYGFVGASELSIHRHWRKAASKTVKQGPSLCSCCVEYRTYDFTFAQHVSRHLSLPVSL